MNNPDNIYLQNHPRCIDGVASVPDTKLKEKLLATLGSHSKIFGLECKCGSRRMRVLGTVVEGIKNEMMTGPIVITCQECDQNQTVFDPSMHGYDGELGHNLTESDVDTEIVSCPNCANSILEVAVAFQYSGEVDEFVLDKDLDIDAVDLFDWVAFRSRCISCDVDFEFSNIECA